MKNLHTITVTIVASLIFCVSYAQPRLTAAKNNYEMDRSLTFHNFDAGKLSPGEAGTNVIWDFSQLSTGGSAAIKPQSSSAGPNAHLFPNANTYISMPGVESYMVIDEDEYSLAGYIRTSDNATEKYSDPREYLKFPITYQDTFNETMKGTRTVNGESKGRSGTIQIIGDGYGTLIMPYGTIHDVLRIKVITTYYDEFMNTPVFTYHDTTYYWWNPDTPGMILKYTVLEMAGIVKYSGSYQNPDLVGIADEEATLINELEIFPNPASDHVRIQYDVNQAGNLSIALKNINGQQVLPIFDGQVSAGIRRHTFQVTDLPKGVYFLEINEPHNRSVQRLIVQ